MSCYYFLSPREKSKYFHIINLDYRVKVQPSEPPGSAPKKKTIQFKKRFEIKPFNDEECCQELHKRKSYMELYIANDKAKKEKKTKTK